MHQKLAGNQEHIDLAKDNSEAIISSIKHCYKQNDKLKLFWEENEYPITESFINLAIIEQEEVKEKERRMKGKGREGHKGTYREKRISSYEEIHKPKKEIKIEELFKDPNSKKLVIYGRAGIGKTTLCQYLTVAWEDEKLWKDKFEVVIKIPLRELAKYIETSQYATLEGFISETYIHGINRPEEKEINGFLRANTSKTLFILDGYDEIAPLFSKKDIGSKLSSIIKNILGDPSLYVIVTSRPLKIEHKFDQELENVGFIDQDIEKYVSIFKPEGAKSILTFLKNNKNLWGIAHIPINLELICNAWGISGGIDKIETISELYATITHRLLERYIVKNHYKELEEVDEALLRKKTSSITKCLERIAFKGMQNNQIIIPIRDIEGIIEEEQERSGESNLLRKVLMSGFIKIIGGEKNRDKEIYFLHLSFQEYYAAKYIARSLENIKSEEYEQVVSLIREDKYTPYYEVIWWFVAGLLYQRGRAAGSYEVLTRFWEILEGEPKDLIGVRHTNLIIRCLEECKASDKVGKHKELINYINQWIKIEYNSDSDNPIIEILSNTPHVARTTFPALLKFLKCDNRMLWLELLKNNWKLMLENWRLLELEDWEVRQGAVKSLGKLGQATPEVIKALINAL
ncbi:hypothetical protein NF27_EI00010, partial [Candidatus Jidaibacter acanthamoeba]